MEARASYRTAADAASDLVGVGVVVIGRNEGSRLAAALASTTDCSKRVVYADSASSDQSVKIAQTLGVSTVAVSPPGDMTAARGRNAGFLALRRMCPHLRFVQFLDGDSALEPGWLSAAARALDTAPDVVAVCGHLREHNRDVSLVRRLLDMEWRRAVGTIASPGGIFMVRVDALEAAGLFDASMARGEEADLAIRLRAQGGQIVRIDQPMAIHDAGMSSLRPWFIRCARNGRGYAEGVARYGRADDGANARRLRSCLVWGFLAPILCVAGCVAAVSIHPAAAIASAAIATAWLAQVARTAWRCRAWGPRNALVYGLFCMIAKIPESWGALHATRTVARRSAG